MIDKRCLRITSPVISKMAQTNVMKMAVEEHKRVFLKTPILNDYKTYEKMPVIGPEGIFVTKWFKEAAETNDNEVIKSALQKNMSLLRTILGPLSFRDFKGKNGRWFREWSTWCSATDQDLSAESMDKVTDFYVYMTDKAQPRKGNKKSRSKAHTAVSVLTTVFWFDKLRVYQGWAAWDMNHERKSGEVAETVAFKQLRAQWKSKAMEIQRSAPTTAASARAVKNRLKPEEEKRITQAYRDPGLLEDIRDQTSRDRIVMRVITVSLLSRSTMCRGIDLRTLRDAQIFVHKMPHIGPAPCKPLAVSLTRGKTLRTVANDENLVGFVRDMCRESCAVSALSAFKVFQEDLQPARGNGVLAGIESYMRAMKVWIAAGCHGDKPEATWRQYHLVFVRDPLKPICYDTHNTDVHRLRNYASVEGKLATTHLSRTDRACHIIEAGGATKDVETAGGWGLASEGQKTYLPGGLSAAVILSLAGWKDADSFFCAWEGNEADIYRELKNLVFPRIDRIYNLIGRASKFASENPKVLSEDDWLPESMMCETYMYLRKVFIEDAVYMRPNAMDWPAYRDHPVFDHPLWPIYAAEENDRVKSRLAKFHSETNTGMLKGLRNILLEKGDGDVGTSQNKKRKYSDADIQSLAAALSKDTSKMPSVLEPDNLYMAYTQFKEVWEVQDHMEWSVWFPFDTSSKSRYHKCSDTYRYINTCITTMSTDAKTVVDKLGHVAKALNVCMRDLVKNCFYFAYNPPKSADVKRGPKCTRTDLNAALVAVGLPTV